MRARLAAILLLALSACKTDAPTPKSPGQPVAKAAETSSQTDHGIQAGPSIGPRTQGVPHSTNIDMVTLSDDGRMALTRDSLGGLRLWPGLDGDAEPILVPVRGARQVSLAKADEGTIIGAVDSIGALHILRAQADGSMQELYMGSPHTPVAQVHVLRDGKQLVTLSKDYRVALIDTSGKVLSEIQERRFRPTAMRLVEDSHQIVAIESDGRGVGGSMNLKTVDMDLAKATLALREGEREIDGVFDVSSRRLDVSPDGKHVAFLDAEKAEPPSTGAAPRRPMPPRNGQTPPTMGVRIANIETGVVRSVELPFPAHEILQVSVAFSSENELLVSSRPTGGSWKVTLGAEIASTPLSSPVANDTQRSASDVSRGVRLAADGTWLFVQDVAAKTHHYLGYGAFDPQFSSLSPNGERVAWSTGAMVFVESVHDDAKSTRITAPPTEAYFRAAFIDDAHVVTVDYSGGLHLIDWAKGTQVSSLDTGGPVREFEIDQERKLVRGIRQNGGTWLVELSKAGLVGPHLIQDRGYRSGFLRGEKALWSIDSSNKLRSYSLRDIRKGLSTAQLQRDATDLSSKLPTAIDSAGRHFVIQAQSQGASLTIRTPGEEGKKELALASTPALIFPSPDGTKLALVSANSSTVEVVTGDDARSLWSRSFLQGVRHVSWSADSKSLAVASQVGAIVQEAETGVPSRLGCGPWFEKRDTPPPSTVSFLQVQNLCEIEP